ncbi:MAG: hypothetical protein K2W95_22175 [Candidatus Obscuribacterales bacterium]|nr:hypothetical protein [Candidatus Obscuribacterales bacterium]
MRYSIQFLVTGAVVCSLAACTSGDKSSTPANDLAANVAKINADQSNDPASATYTEQQRQDLANSSTTKPPEMNTSGITFAPGPLPESLAGKTFYSTESFGGQVTFTSESEATFKPYRAPEIPVNYKVKNHDSPSLSLTYKEDGSERTIVYEITRGERYAMLHLAEPTAPWPIMLKGIAE